MSFKKEIEFLENNPHNIFVVNYGTASDKNIKQESVGIEHRSVSNSVKLNIKINEEQFQVTEDLYKVEEHVYCLESSQYLLNSDFTLNSEIITINDTVLKNRNQQIYGINRAFLSSGTKSTIEIDPSISLFMEKIYSFIESNNIPQFKYSISEYFNDEKEQEETHYDLMIESVESREKTLNALNISIKKATKEFPIEDSCMLDPNILEAEYFSKKIISNLNEMLFEESSHDQIETIEEVTEYVNGLKNIMSIYVKDGFLDKKFKNLNVKIESLRSHILNSDINDTTELVNNKTMELIEQIKETTHSFHEEHNSYLAKYQEIETLKKHQKHIESEIKIEQNKELKQENELRKKQSFITIVIPDTFLQGNKSLKETLDNEGINFNKFSELNKALNKSEKPDLLIKKLKTLSSEAQIETVYYINNVDSSSKIKNLLASKKIKPESQPSIDRNGM